MRRAVGLLTGLASAAALAACGVPPSSVIQAGDPAVGMTPGVSVYFLAQGDLLAVPRAAPPGRSGLSVALRLLFAGPSATETYKLTTELPTLPQPPWVGLDGTTTVVRLPAGAGRLTPLGLEQVVCTVAANPLAPPGLPADPAPKTAATGETGAAAPATSPPVPTSVRPNVRVVGAGWDLTRPTDTCP